ncbi:LysR family transcriptional regulator [Thauera sp. 63]|jgi:DNA-binding transcriptional LysR family regulator|uniref:LysR family transcriptional regulator n=1 Tax=Thauera sp. 63 TaxID=497321 RepID=UPI0002CFE963|nr:LysR family transcriptional regulator [Thauera sp. 63]ENO75970.1 RuBisCO transcriptional regulator [Thauera sp. 63]
MKLSALQAFVAAINDGSLRKAAVRLGLSQPALSKMLRELEVELGASLVVRSTRGVIPTAQGKVLYERASAADRELTRAVEEIGQLGGRMVGELSIAAVPLAVMLVLPEAVRTFSQQFPEMRLRISEELYIAQLAYLRKGEADVAIGPIPEGLAQGEYLVEPLLPIDMVVAVRKGHPQARCTRLAELSEARWVYTGLSGATGYARELFSRNGLPPPPVAATVNSTLALLALLGSGDFIGLMPAPLARHPVTSSYFDVVPLQEGPLRLTLGVMVREEMAMSVMVRHFLSHLHRAAHHLGGMAGTATS